jgi:hypothetical protein
MANSAKRIYIALTASFPGFWGKGDDIAEAERNMRRAGRIDFGATQSAKILKDAGYYVYGAHPDSYVNGMGALSYPVSDEPVCLVNKAKVEKRWKLVDEKTGDEIKLRDMRETHNKVPVEVLKFMPPHKPGSSGKVLVDFFGAERVFFASVIGGKFVEC